MFPPFPSFDARVTDTNNVGTEWSMWVKRFEDFVVAYGIKMMPGTPPFCCTTSEKTSTTLAACYQNLQRLRPSRPQQSSPVPATQLLYTQLHAGSSTLTPTPRNYELRSLPLLADEADRKRVTQPVLRSTTAACEALCVRWPGHRD